MTDYHAAALLTLLEVLGIGAMWLVTLLRTPSAIRSAWQRPLWLAVACGATSMTLQLAWVGGRAAQLCGTEHGVSLARDFIGLFAATAIVVFVARTTGLLRLSRAAYGSAVLTVVALVLLDIGFGPHGRHIVPGDPARAPVPGAAYWLVMLGYHLAANIACATACWGFSRRVGHRPLRIGLRLFGAGVSMAGLLMILSIVHLYTRSAALVPVFSAVVFAESLFMAAGTAVPLAQGARRAVRNGRKIHRLYPLWHALTEDLPDIRLERDRGRLVDVVSSAGDSELHLYRRNIEIRDALLTLGKRVPAQTLDRAYAHVEEHAAAPEDRDAAAVACSARLAKNAEGSRRNADGTPLELATIGGADLAGDIHFLIRVSEFYESALARKFVQDHSEDTRNDGGERATSLHGGDARP